ncbi:TonB-dependent receptor [Formosa agariphila KMM 3901]|uniref:TonB-dependent receptor n=2 Tax=Formosa TaxID=225842 RepID=T2KQZ1_FORAG|nr:TonB-dependent receptor [Formosa agariphila KMM 3901]
MVVMLLYSFIGYTQTKISGKVTDSLNALASVNILLKDSSDALVAYTFSNAEGIYALEDVKTGVYVLEFSALGYHLKKLPIDVYAEDETLQYNVVLHEKAMALDEVYIATEKPISVQKDTITFKTKYFTNGTEQTVEELLEKIPGLNIDSDGKIKVGNQEIEKLMVDGDDFFEKGYKILSKNMPAYPIEEVEVLKNYSNNRLLKNIEDSDKVALNLKLDDASKRIWFGNLKLGLGNDDFYELKGNLMNFGKKNKYYFLTNLNSIGEDATGDIQNLINPFRLNEPGSIGDNQSANNIINLSAATLNFNKDRTNFNNVELLSLNAIFNPSDKLKIKTLGFFNWDEIDFYRTTTDVVYAPGTDFINTEDYKLRSKNKTAFGKVDLTYNISKTKMLEATTKYNISTFNKSSHLVFNGLDTRENLNDKNIRFDQKINYTNKFKDKSVFLITGRFIDENTPQQYSVNQFLFHDLFPEDSTANNVKQQSANHMQFAGINAHILDRRKNENLLELQLGNTYRKDRLNTAFSLYNDTDLVANPDGYQNKSTYTVNDLYLKSKYSFNLKAFKINGTLNIHQLFNRLESSENISTQSPFYVNPSLGLEWKINNKNKITSRYVYNTTNAGILDVYSDYVLSSFRTFQKGASGFNLLDASNVFVGYTFGNWSDRFFANTFFTYTKNHDFLTTQSIVEQNYSELEKIRVEDREFISVNTKFDYYFKTISSNLKLDLGYTKSEFKNSVNNSGLRQVTSHNYNYGFELRSGFSGVFNYHLGTKWSSSKVETTITNSYTDVMSFLDLTFVLSELFNTQLQLERYYFGSLNTENTYYFLDFDANYRLIKDKLELGLTAKNLFNTERFKTYSVSDIGTSSTEYRLQPRYVLLKLEYKF